MNLTRKFLGPSITNVTLQGSGLILLFAFTHTVSDAITNMLSALGAGGTLGIAMGPIIIMVLLANLALSYTPWLMIPGILFGALMFMLPSQEARPTGRNTTSFLTLIYLLDPWDCSR